MAVPGVRASHNLQATLRRSGTGFAQQAQRRYAGTGTSQPSSPRNQKVTAAAAIAAASIPVVWYFSSSTPDIPIPTHVTNSPSDASRTQTSGGNSGDDAQKWARLPSSGIKRGKKHENPLGQELGKGEEFVKDADGNLRQSTSTAKDEQNQRGPISGEVTGKQFGVSTGPTKHSLPLDQDKTKSKKSTGEPETAKAQGTVPAGPQK